MATVVKPTIIRLKELVGAKRNSCEMHQEQGDVSDAELAQWWLDYGITRKVTKSRWSEYEEFGK